MVIASPGWVGRVSLCSIGRSGSFRRSCPSGCRRGLVGFKHDQHVDCGGMSSGTAAAAHRQAVLIEQELLSCWQAGRGGYWLFDGPLSGGATGRGVEPAVSRAVPGVVLAAGLGGGVAAGTGPARCQARRRAGHGPDRRLPASRPAVLRVQGQHELGVKGFPVWGAVISVSSSGTSWLCWPSVSRAFISFSDVVSRFSSSCCPARRRTARHGRRSAPGRAIASSPRRAASPRWHITMVTSAGAACGQVPELRWIDASRRHIEQITSGLVTSNRWKR